MVFYIFLSLKFGSTKVNATLCAPSQIHLGNLKLAIEGSNNDEFLRKWARFRLSLAVLPNSLIVFHQNPVKGVCWKKTV